MIYMGWQTNHATIATYFDSIKFSDYCSIDSLSLGSSWDRSYANAGTGAVGLGVKYLFPAEFSDVQKLFLSFFCEKVRQQVRALCCTCASPCFCVHQGPQSRVASW